MEKILSFIIPCYGKTNEIVRKTLKTIEPLLKKHNELEVIFVYKNLNNYDYDWVQDEFPSFKCIKEEDTTKKRTAKIKLGLEQTIGKYFYTLDPDDLIRKEDIEKIIDFLKQKNEDVILMNYFISKSENDDKGKLIKVLKKEKINKKLIGSFLGNFCFLFKTESFKRKMNLFYSDEHVWVNDVYMALVSLTNKSTLIKMNHSLIVYKKMDGNSALKSFVNPQYLSFTKNLLEQFLLYDFDLKNHDVQYILYKFFQVVLNTFYIVTILLKEKKEQKPFIKLVFKTIKQKNLFSSKKIKYIKTINFLIKIFGIHFVKRIIKK